MPHTPHPDDKNPPDFESLPPSDDFISRFSREEALRLGCCAVKIDDEHDLLVALANTPPSTIANVGEKLRRECEAAIATREQLNRLIARAYPQSHST